MCSPRPEDVSLRALPIWHVRIPERVAWGVLLVGRLSRRLADRLGDRDRDTDVLMITLIYSVVLCLCHYILRCKYPISLDGHLAIPVWDAN